MEIKNVSFSYSEETFIKALSSRIEERKITTILGPNGSGKSTLLNLLVHQLKPQSGEVLVDGKNINRMTVKEVAKKLDEKVIAMFEKMAEGNPHKPTPEKRKRYQISGNHLSEADLLSAAELFRERIEADV